MDSLQRLKEIEEENKKNYDIRKNWCQYTPCWNCRFQTACKKFETPEDFWKYINYYD